MKTNIKIALSVLAVVIIGTASYFLFARDMFYKYSDFKKLSGKVEACTIKGTEIAMYKYLSKDGSIILTGDKGEYIPCVIQDGSASEQCEAMLSMLATCSIVLDTDNKVYSTSIHSKVPLIVANIATNTEYQANYIADLESRYIVRTYASADMMLVLKNEKDIASGEYMLTENGEDNMGEWIQSETNKNKVILLDRTEISIILSGNTMTFNGKVLTLKK